METAYVSRFFEAMKIVGALVKASRWLETGSEVGETREWARRSYSRDDELRRGSWGENGRRCWRVERRGTLRWPALMACAVHLGED